MSLTDATQKVVAALSPRKRSSLAYPTEKPLAPEIQKKIDVALAERERLNGQSPQVALRATLQEEGGQEAYDQLKLDIAVQDRILADLQLALTAAQEADAALQRRVRAQVHKNQLNQIRQRLRKRDEAAQSFSVAIERAVTFYRAMVHEAEAADALCRAIGADEISKLNTGGWRLQRDEIYRAACGEIMRASVEWPIRAENAQQPMFPYDRAAGITTVFDRADLAPIADDFKSRSEGLMADLQGSAPSAD